MRRLENARYPDIETTKAIGAGHGTDVKLFNPPNDGWDKDKLNRYGVESKQFN